MGKELRIAVLVFLVYFMYGVSSLFSLGDMVTPYFLNTIVFAIVSLVYLLMNWSLNGRFFLFIAFVVQIIGVLVDVVIMEQIAQRLNGNLLINFVNSKEFIYISLIGYFSGLLLLLIPFQRVVKSMVKTTVLASLIGAGFVCILLGFSFLSEMLLACFYLSYFIFIRLNSEKNTQTVEVISALFLLILLLNTFKYLV